MAITNAQRDKAWIDMINGKRKTAGGKIIRTKADLLEVKQYLPMVSKAVKDAYNKRMASFRDSADSVETIAAKYGHKLQNDAAKGGKLNEAELHKLLTKIGVAKRKIDEAEAAEKEYGQLLNSLNAIARSLSFNEKQKAKEIFKQYKSAPKILGLY